MPINRTRAKAGAAIAITVSLIISTLFGLGAFERLEWISFDQRMALFRGDAPLHPEVAVVLIDDASLQAMDPVVGRYPWPRSIYGDLMEFLAMGGARAVVFDILFVERERGRDDSGLSPNDQQLNAATAGAGIVYHAGQLSREKADDGRKEYPVRPLPEGFRGKFAIDATGFADAGNNSYLLPFDGLWQSARGIGIVGLDPDSDGIYRRSRLLRTYQGGVYPTLPVAPLLDTLPGPIVLEAKSLHLGTTEIPLARDGSYLINMASDHRAYSISGIFASIQKLREGEVEDLLVYPDEFENKIVFIGASAVGLEDIKATSVAKKTPGVMIHASVTSNILAGDFLWQLPAWFSHILIFVFTVLTIAIILLSPHFLMRIGLPVLLASAYATLAVAHFQANIVYDLTAPILAIALTWLSGFAFVAFTEGRDKRRVRTMMSQYVSPAVLAQVTNHYEDQLKAEVGTQENLSVLFSDIRSFTTLSETLAAEQVVELLNTYFSVMGDVVFRHEGTLDKFIGDAIMAFWGAPIRIADHAERAVRTAVEMQRKLEGVNQTLSEKGYPALRIGVGINTGKVVLGNIGSEKKLDYTVIGDGVNLASRMEGLTKKYGCPALISETTYRALAAAIPCAMIDLVRVKGKQIPIRIYWPLALPEDDEKTLAEAATVVELSRRAFAAYTERRWEQAIELYAGLPNKPLCEVFIARCRQYRETPPPEDWDGVFVLTSK